jgi:hypothetical protein
VRRRDAAALIAATCAIVGASANAAGRETDAMTFEIAGWRGSVWQPQESGPYASPFVQHESPGGLGIPVMHQGGTRDLGITPLLVRPRGAHDLTAAPTYFVEFRGANHFAWTDLVNAYPPSIIQYCAAFLNRSLKGEAGVDLGQRLADVTDLRAK